LIHLFVRGQTALALWFSFRFDWASVCSFPCHSFHPAFAHRTMIYPLPFHSFLFLSPFSTRKFLVSFISSHLAFCSVMSRSFAFHITSLANFLALSLFIFVVQQMDDIFYGQDKFIRVSIPSPLHTPLLPFVSPSLLR